MLAQADQQFRKTPQDISRLKDRNASGEMVPIGTVTNFQENTEPYRQPRYNLYPAADVLGSAAPDVASGTAMKRMEEIAKEVLPQGFAIEGRNSAISRNSRNPDLSDLRGLRLLSSSSCWPPTTRAGGCRWRSF